MSRVYTNWENDNFTWMNETRSWNSLYDVIVIPGETEEFINWENDNFTWNNEIRAWDEVCEIIYDLLGGGSKNPEEYGEMPYQQQALRDQLQRNLDRLKLDKKEKLIEILVLIDGKKYESKKIAKNKKDVKVTINDVKLITNNYLNIEIKYIK